MSDWPITRTLHRLMRKIPQHELTHEFLESLLKIALPALGQSLDFNRPAQQSNVVFLAGIQLGNIGDADTGLAFFDQLDGLTSFDLSFLQHGKIEARALTRQKPL